MFDEKALVKSYVLAAYLVLRIYLHISLVRYIAALFLNTTGCRTPIRHHDDDDVGHAIQIPRNPSNPLIPSSPIGVLHGNLFALRLGTRVLVLERHPALDLHHQREDPREKAQEKPRREAECPQSRRHRSTRTVDLMKQAKLCCCCRVSGHT